MNGPRVKRPELRLLPWSLADGPHNMAADEALLESAGEGVASLRFYGWSEPTLSLGYFQPQVIRRQDPVLADLPFVRRPSGGAALIHHHEVTYALALPAGLPWQGRESPTGWLCRAHRIIAAALAGLGVALSACTGGGAGPFTGLLCFQHHTPGDLRIGNDKVAGSAQRRRRGALLQHGAVLLAASPHALVLPGVRELAGKHLEAEEVCAALWREWARDTGWDLVEGDWTSRERQRTGELVRGKYSQPAWNDRR